MKNYFLFLLFSILCVLPATASAATLRLGGPSSASVGGTFNVPVLLTTAAGESANAVSGTVTYPANLLTLVSISKAGSIITLWPSEPTQTTASADFEGVILNPGYSGSGGTVVTLTFQAKAVGTAAVAFTDASVLANDGNATPILTGTSPTSIAIAAPSVAPAIPAPVAPVKTTPKTAVPQPASAPAIAPVPYIINLSPAPQPQAESSPAPASPWSGVVAYVEANGLLLSSSAGLLLALFLLARFIFTYPLIPVAAARRRRAGAVDLHEQFDELREAVTQELFALQHAKTKRQLTDEEEHFLVRFEKMLNKVERTAEAAIKP
jgi:hypothetical protein